MTAAVDWPAIGTGSIGAVVGRRIVTVTPRMTMAFAAGIGADDGLYLDDARPEGIVAPLAIAVALDWPVLVAPDYLAAIGRDERTIFDGLVHGFQDSTFIEPVRPGMTLEISGRIAEITATPAGTLVVCRIRTLEHATRRPITDSWFGSMFRRTPPAGATGAVETRPALRPQADLDAASPTERVAIDIPRVLAHVYTECAQMWNPIHTERRFALESGLPDIILHGPCLWALASQRIAVRYRPAQAHPLTRFAARFSRMVIPGTRITLEHTSNANDEVAFVVRNAQGELALTHGLAALAP